MGAQRWEQFMRRAERISGLTLVLFAFWVLPDSPPARAEAPMVAKLISLQGQVAVSRASDPRWKPARIGQPLEAGDSVRTGPASSASILCVDESQIRLNENTIVILKSIAPSFRLQPVTPAKGQPPPASRYEVPQGEIWLRNKHEKFHFELETPAVTAIIRGTELNIKVQRNGATRVILLEGNVCIANPQGEVCLRPGEEGYALPGQKPTKRLLVEPTDAVQWVLYYPGIISYRDLPLTPLPGEVRTPPGPPAVAPLIREGEAAYDQGRLSEAGEKAQAVLAQDPGNSRALTLLGWVSLQEHKPDEALKQFRQVRQPDDLNLVGLALALYELGDATGPYQSISAAMQKGKPSPLLVTMSGYTALMAGRVEEARSRLEAAVNLPPPAPRLGRALLVQIDLVQNRKEAAQTEASQALALAPDSPMALFSMGLVKMASFDLPAATRYLEKAIDADPRFVEAYVYLAKIWLGSEYLSRAQRTIDKALHLAPRDPLVLSLAGFVRLAFRDYSAAFQYWNQALQANPRFGEPHLGLGIYYFRHREFRHGLEEMLTATLLDPRVASYQTELGKALFQTRSFDRALEIYDYAKTLDPRDPTPYFYKGIALSDLHRPGEAIQEINQSVELNDNVAMFRARSLLDQDLAVRNYSLAKSYQQLGLNEWAYSKAVTAVKYNPHESSAHLFLRDVILGATSEASFLTGGLLRSTADIEATLFRVLSRANQATFSNIPLNGTEALGFTTDYTPMFEMPYGRAVASGGIGAWEGGKSIQDHQGLIYAGAPGVAAGAYVRYFDSRGANWPSDVTVDSFNGNGRAYDIEALAKWEPTVKGTLSGFYQYTDQKATGQGTFRQAPQFPIVDPMNNVQGNNVVGRQRFYELAYYHRFNPQVASLVYYAHLEYPYHRVISSSATSNIDAGYLGLGGLGFPSFPFSEQARLDQTFDRASNNVQAQQHLRLSCLGQHSLIGGFDYLTGPAVSQRRNLTDTAIIDTSALVPFGFPSTLVLEAPARADFQSPQWSYSFYLLDYWRPFQGLVLELGLFKDFNKAVRSGISQNLLFSENIYTSLWSPRFGANYQFGVNGTQHVLRAALGRYLNTHLITQPILVPAETASFPWAIDSGSGTEIRQAGAAWEAQWNSRTFTTLRLNALRLSTPTFFQDNAGLDHPIWQTWKQYQASFVLNRILVSSLGLSLGVMGKRVIPDLSYAETDGLESYAEFNAFIGLAYLHPQGWLARIRPLLVQQYGKITGHTADSPFVILNLTVGRDFPNKRGFALFEVQNLFNRRPFYSLEPARDLEFSNQRRFLFRVGLYF
jgi:tetratricopeptide (TPR) repeat protein